MTETNRSIHIAALVAAAGGAAWLAKMAVIVATDGSVSSGANAAGAFYVLGVVLLMAGAATLTLRAARGRGRVATAGAYLLAPVVFFVSFVVLESIAKAIVGDAGPSWVNDEAGIALTGTVWLAVGLASRRR